MCLIISYSHCPREPFEAHVAVVVYKSSITLVFVSVVSDVKPYTEHSMFGCMRKAKFFWRKQKTLSAFFTFLSLSYSFAGISEASFL